MPVQNAGIAVTAFAANYVDECRAKGETFKEIADKLGVTSAYVYNVRKPGNGAGPKLENALARVLFGGSVDKLRKNADAWWAEHGRAESYTRKRARGEDPLPRRAEVIDMFRDELRPETIRRLQADPRETDMTKLEWVKYADLLDGQVRREEAEAEANRRRRKPAG